MSDGRARRNGQARARRGEADDGPARARWGAWLAPLIGAAVIVGLAAAASFAQATPEVFIAASLVFSLCEGVVLAVVGYVWRERGPALATLAGAITAAMAAPVRWEVALARTAQPVQPTSLAADLVVSMAWGALAGLAGATILKKRIATLMRA